MPTIVSHALVPLALAAAAGPVRIPRQVAVAGALLAMVPDADVVGLRLGVALWWPVDKVRLFWPVTPVRVSPIGAGFFSARGLETVVSELAWIWLPCALVGLAGLRWRRTSPPPGPSSP